MRLFFYRSVILLFSLFSTVGIAEPQSIRVAVLENLKLEKLSTDKYATDYMDGLTAAIEKSKAEGFPIELKTFFYGKEPMAILGQIPEIRTWNPDIVIGPRSSSLFLMLKGQFSDVLVLSPFATATEVSRLPDNFYSLTLPNEYFTRATANLVRNRFKGKAVTPIAEVDCKNCIDFVEEFSTTARTSGIVVRPATTFLNKNAETESLTDLLAQYQRGDIILLPNTSYTSGTLIARLSDHLKDNTVTFIGGDGWGDWSSSYVGKVKSTFNYSAYRATPWSLDSADSQVKSFSREFRKIHNRAPTGVASLLSYSTLTAALNALKIHGSRIENYPMRRRILESFKAARSTDPNYARPVKYAVYRVTQSGEQFAGEVSAVK